MKNNQMCRGARDLLPGDMTCFRYVEDTFRMSCCQWGYQEVRTPTLEYLHLFTAVGTLTPSKLGKVYSFLDWDGWSGERVVLRPDGTIPMARLYSRSLSEKTIARLFYVTNVFAFEATGKENREKWQCGVEFVGSSEPVADVEIMMLANEIMRKLGLGNIELELSHAGLVRALIKELKLDPEKEVDLVSAVLDGKWQALVEAHVPDSNLHELLGILLNLQSKSSSFLHNARALASRFSQDIHQQLDDFVAITAILDKAGCNYNINLKAVKGFEYYTGLCFKLLTDGHEVGGGGRYNNLIPLIGGKDVPACGFALYIDSIMGLLPASCRKGDEGAIMITIEKEVTADRTALGFQLAQLLHRGGYTAVLDFEGGGPFRYRWSVVVTENEAIPFRVSDNQRNQQWDMALASDVVEMLEKQG